MSDAITTSPLYTLVSVVSPKAQFLFVYNPISTFISSLSLNHHLYPDDFLFFQPSEFHSNYLISLTCKITLQHISSWMTANFLALKFSTLLKLSFFLSDLNNNFLKHTTLLLLQSTLLATFALFMMNTLPFHTKSLHLLNPATITFVNFAVSAHISTSKQPAPLPPPFTIATSIVHSKLDCCNSLYYNLPNYQRNRLQQIQNSLARAVVEARKSSHITPIFKSLHWLKVNERI